MLDNVKSEYIVKEIFKKIKNKRKLNIIKYNKRIKNRLNISKDDFEIYINLKEFNIKYKTNIEDIDIKEINLCFYSEISDILKLEKAGFNKLEILIMKDNEISDVNPL